MKRTEIKQIYKDIASYADKTVTVCGWVRTVRDSKAFGFIELNDGSFFKSCQIVFERATLANYDEIAGQNVGAALVVTGKVVATPENKQPFEIKASAVSVEGESTPDYPLQKKRHTMEFLREKAYLRPRTNTYSAVFRIRSDCEGAGAMFQVTTLDVDNLGGRPADYSEDFFGKKTSLTVSGQLNGETYAMAYGKIYTFGPTFRAEKSNTARHAAEFWMIEPEIAFADLDDNMSLAEDMVKFIIEHCTRTCAEEIDFLNRFIDTGLKERLDFVLKNDFARVTYTEAIEKLLPVKDKFQFPVYWGCDLQSEHERYLTETVYKKPLFLIDYPKEIKAFYMRLNDDGKTVAAMDLLVPGIGELIGGSQREEREDVLKARMKELGLKEEDYWWYLDLRRFGGTKHAGYGLGFERMIMYLTGISNIRDVIPFPRTVGHCDF